MLGRSHAARYGLFGVAFGACFPLVATAVTLAGGEAEWSLAAAAAAHRASPLLWMIDTAPLFLGLFGAFAGLKQQELDRTLTSLERLVQERTEDLSEERTEAQEAATRAELVTSRLEGVLQSSGDSILVLGAEGRIELANRATEAMFGYPPDELTGERLSTLVPELEGWPRSDPEDPAASAAGRSRRRIGRRRDGTEFALAMSVSEHRSHESATYLALIRDVTAEERVEAERALRELEARVLHRLLTTASAGADALDAIRRGLESLCTLTGWPIGHAYLRDPQAPDRLVSSGIWVLPADPVCPGLVEATGETVVGVGEGLVGAALESGAVGWMRDVTTAPESVQGRVGERAEVRGTVTFPVTVDDEVFAVIELFSAEPVDEDPRFGAVLEIVGMQLGRVVERARARDELVRAKEAAEIANRTKTSFLANMSHELRTPLNAIIGFTKIVLRSKEGLGDKDVAYLERVHANGMHLLTLINEILDIAKIESGRVALDLGPCDVGALVREVLDLQESLATERGLSLEVEMPERLHPIVADATRLRQTLINLVGNGLKFTDQGGVTVRLVPYERSAALQRIEVEDTGIGIPAEHLDRVFEPFRQVTETADRPYGGTGLGLSLTRSFCVSMGLSLRVRSEQGVGSTFVIEVPRDKTLRPQSGEVRFEEALRRTTDRLRRADALRRVLVIDDDEDSRTVATELLERHGCEVRCAANGEEGLRVARAWVPDLILVDLVMPVMDGWELLSRLRDDPLLRGLPAVVVSAAADLGGADRGLALIRKPLDRDTVRRLLGDSARKTALIVDDAPDARELLRVAVTDLGWHAVVARDGREALALLDEVKPAAVFLDYRMPEMDGAELLGHLRQRPELDEVPIVVVTAEDVGDAGLVQFVEQSSGLLRKGDGLPRELRRVLDALDG